MNQTLQNIIEQGWGDLASIAGLLVALIGFAITIIGVWKSRSAAESAKKAAYEARSAIVRTEIIANFSSAVTAMDEVKRLHRAEAWNVMPDRYSSLRRTLISICSSHPNLNEEHRKLIQSSIAQFRELESLVESFLAGGKTSPSSAKLNKIVTAQIDKLDEVLNSIKSEAE